MNKIVIGLILAGFPYITFANNNDYCMAAIQRQLHSEGLLFTLNDRGGVTPTRSDVQLRTLYSGSDKTVYKFTQRRANGEGDQSINVAINPNGQISSVVFRPGNYGASRYQMNMEYHAGKCVVGSARAVFDNVDYLHASLPECARYNEFLRHHNNDKMRECSNMVNEANTLMGEAARYRRSFFESNPPLLAETPSGNHVDPRTELRNSSDYDYANESHADDYLNPVFRAMDMIEFCKYHYEAELNDTVIRQRYLHIFRQAVEVHTPSTGNPESGISQ